MLSADMMDEASILQLWCAHFSVLNVALQMPWPSNQALLASFRLPLYRGKGAELGYFLKNERQIIPMRINNIFNPKAGNKECNWQSQQNRL